MILGVSLGVGIPLFVGLILFLVFSAIRRNAAEQRKAIESEGVVLDSGTQWITIRLNHFRAPGLYVSGGLDRTRMSMILTQSTLHFTPSRRAFLHINRAQLDQYTVHIDTDGALRIHSETPPNASGSIDYRIAFPEASTWAKALIEAGAKNQ